MLDNIYVKYALDLILMFLVVYLLYTFLINRKRKEFDKLKKSNEIVIFILRFNLNMKKITYKKLLNQLTIINSFIIAFNSLLLIYIDNYLFGILCAFVSLLIMIYTFYELLGRYYVKKGYSLNDEDKEVEKNGK